MSENVSTVLANLPCKAVFMPDAIGPVIEKTPRPPELDNMQSAVGGGMVEHVSTFNIRPGIPCQVYVNEDGRMKGMRVNVAGTEFLRLHDARFRAEPPLVGPVVVLAGRAAVWK